MLLFLLNQDTIVQSLFCGASPTDDVIPLTLSRLMCTQDDILMINQLNWLINCTLRCRKQAEEESC